MKISSRISYHRYNDFFIVLDHRSGREYRLNADGGTIIENIDHGKGSGIDINSEFIQSLKATGIIENNLVRSTAPKKIPTEKEKSSVFDELVIYAAKRIIPVSTIVELTYRCPLNCTHCYIDRSEVPEKDEIEKEDYFKFIDNFHTLGGIYAILTGGDPLLHKDFESVFNYFRAKRIAVSIMSSGFNPDHKLLKRIAKKGISTFQVSIHGHNSEIHDNFTGVQGSFDSAVTTLRTMKQLGVSVQAAISVNRNNVKFFNNILDFLENKQIETVINYEMFPKRNGDMSPVDLNITGDELLQCIKTANKKFSSRLKDKNPDDFPCNAARSLFSLDPAGNVFPCLEIRRKAGNIKNETLDHIWKNSQTLKTIRKIKLSDLKDCPDCIDRNYCNRCHGNAIKNGMEITAHSFHECVMAKAQKKLHEKIT